MVIYRPLGREQIKQIVEIQLQALRYRLAERNITLSLTEAAKEAVARKAFDPVYGARPLRRAIQKDVVQPLAMRLLRADFHDGDHIQTDVRDDELVFERTSQQVTESPLLTAAVG